MVGVETVRVSGDGGAGQVWSPGCGRSLLCLGSKGPDWMQQSRGGGGQRWGEPVGSNWLLDAKGGVCGGSHSCVLAGPDVGTAREAAGALQ